MPEREFDVCYIAELCRLELTEEEKARFQDQLGSVLDYMRQIDDFEVGDMEPMAHANPVYDVMREDEVQASLSVEEALHNAPQEVQGQFAVTKVVEA